MFGSRRWRTGRARSRSHGRGSIAGPVTAPGDWVCSVRTTRWLGPIAERHTPDFAVADVGQQFPWKSGVETRSGRSSSKQTLRSWRPAPVTSRWAHGV